LSEVNEDALWLLEEYYEAVHVEQRDSPEAIRKLVEDDASGWWLAYLDDKAVGCFVLRRLASIPLAGDCERLDVRMRRVGTALRMLCWMSRRRMRAGRG
jgi:hypothetical protein